MISQVFVLSPRGDAVIFKDFRGDVSKTSAETFFRRARNWDGLDGPDPPPAFCAGGVHYLHVRTGGLWWVATAARNLNALLVLELLLRIAAVVRDMLGSTAEDVVRRNFFLVYEVLDEVADYGIPQNSSTERLKRFIRTEPIRAPSLVGGGGGGGGSAARAAVAAAIAASTSSSGPGHRASGGGGAGGSGPGRVGAGPATPGEVFKSVLDVARTGASDEIFVDVVEKLSATFDASGRVRSSSIAGSVQVKSYLRGNPSIKLGLSDRLSLGRRAEAARARPSADAPEDPVVLDSWQVHEAANADTFEAERALSLRPPEGHFALLSYTSSRPFRPPVLLRPRVEDDAYSADKLTLRLALRADFPPSQTATGIVVSIPLPRGVSRAHVTIEEAPPGTYVDTSSPSPHAHSSSYSSRGPGGFGSRPSAAARRVRPAARLAALVATRMEQSGEWLETERRVVWSLRSVAGGREATLTARLTVSPEAVETVRRTYGPISVQFALPGKPSASGLDVRYLRIMKDERGYNPARWFRVISVADSYQIRPHSV